MFDFFKGKRAESTSRISEEVRSWIDMETTTRSFVMELWTESRPLFTTLAGATFALHQDTLRVYGINMWKTDDLLMGAAMDKMQPHRLGDFPTRVGLVMKAMFGIDNTNLDFIQAGRPHEIGEEEFLLHATMTRMRSTAARTWLLTIYSKIEQKTAFKVSSEAIWLMLQTLPSQELLEDAELFSGTYFDGVKSERMNLQHWPQASSPS